MLSLHPHALKCRQAQFKPSETNIFMIESIKVILHPIATNF